MSTTRENYRRIRREQADWPAHYAYRVAKVLAEIEWQDQRGEMYEPFAIGVARVPV